MNSRFFRVGLGLALLGGAIGAHAQDVPWQVDGGFAAIRFDSTILRAHGIEIQRLTSTAKGAIPMEASAGFEITRNSNMQIMTENQNFGHHLGGFTYVNGGFELRSGKRVVSVMNASITSDGPEQDSSLTMKNGLSGGFAPALTLERPSTYFSIHENSLVVGWTDVKLTNEMASALGRPEAAGVSIGVYTIWSRVRPTQPIPKPVPLNFGLEDNLNVDMRLFDMSSLTASGRDGVAYPNGISGFAMLTTSCNAGNSNIDWFQAMDARHPLIGQDMYRVRDGRIEMVGAAYLKHGFFATNTTNPSCGTGIHPGTGSLLGPGLTDTYGVGNNNDRFWLGPRSEVNPFTGVWTPFGSFFDVGTGGATPDGNRSLSSAQANALPGHKNRIEVRDQDLIVPVGQTWQFIYEAYYLNTSEINWGNQIGSRQNNLAWSGSNWSSSNVTGYMQGVPAIQHYQNLVNAAKNVPAGDVLATMNLVNVLNEGWIYVAVNPIRLGGGLWRYEIAMFNFTSDRQVREFKIPMLPGMTVTNVGFRDIDQTASNDWTGAYNSATGEISWSTQTFAQNPNANSLKYGTLYNLTFTANVAPVANVGTLGLFKTGAVMTNTVNGVAPPNGNVPPATHTIVSGTLIGGGLNELLASDNSYLIVEKNFAQDTVYSCSVQISATAPIAVPGQVRLEVESSADLANRVQRIEFWNRVTSQYDQIRFDLIGVTDTTITASVTGAAAANYVNPTTREVRARLNMSPGAVDHVQSPRYKIDMAKWVIGL